jgi:hypothetical protein
MSDIVKRLHKYASSDHKRSCEGRNYYCECGYDALRDPLIVEAADEIEWLRARETQARTIILTAGVYVPSDGGWPDQWHRDADKWVGDKT